MLSAWSHRARPATPANLERAAAAAGLVTEFSKRFDTVYIVEENEPFIEEQMRYIGITNIVGKERVPLCGELNQRIIRDAFSGEDTSGEKAKVPARPPVLWDVGSKRTLGVAS